MAYCTNSEVRYIIATGLSDAGLTALIVLADAEIDQRGLGTLPANIAKQISMLITASLAAMNDVTSYGKADYEAGSANLSKLYRDKAEALIATGVAAGELPLYVYNEPLNEGDDY